MPLSIHMHPQHMIDMDPTYATVVGCASSSLAPLKKYDVFISFRGEDTRGGFTSHLHAALRRNKMETYIDYRIQKGEEVWVELEKAIKDSTLFLVIFSENYASSTWCLNELVEIMDCKKNEKDVHVIPVFYRIEPSHVRKQTGSYKTALEKQKQSKEKMQKWKETLYEAANLSGFDSHVYRTEFDLIEDVIKDVSQKLNVKDTHELRGLFISDENFSHIESLLRIDSSEVQIIGLWGMGGIGKTTLAAAIFYKFSSQYESCCFLENVAEESKRHGFNHMCNRLLSKLLGEDLHIDTSKVIPSLVMRRLRRMKTFIVLDDMNTLELLENLVGVGRDWLGAGSRVIVTTRDKHLLSKGVDKIYEVKEMNFQNSLRLFSLNAFNKSLPKQGYEEVSKRAVVYTKGIPLALKVLGSFLHAKSENEWNNALTKLKKFPNAEIQKVLRLSYDGLDGNDKNIFLDIACFLKKQERGKVTKLLNAYGFFADIGIRNLLDKALITIDLNDCIKMHDLLQEMGKQIICEESNKIERRSRLWDPEDVGEVLTNNKGTDAIEGILLDMTQITYINLSFNTFRKMSKLRFLAFQALNRVREITNVVYLPKGLESLPKKLIYFEWDGYPLKSLPSNFCPEKLVKLFLRDSNVEKLWHGVQNLPSLEEIDLFGCKYLIECPDLSNAPNLRSVQLMNCKRLPNIHTSIFSLQKLELLFVDRCTSLKSLCSSTCSPSLQILQAWGCVNLQEFSIPLKPNDPFTSRFGLNLGCSGLSKLPSSILQLGNLERFSFPICESLMDLPKDFADIIVLSNLRKHELDTLITLQKLLPTPGFQSARTLWFDSCHGLSKLPDNISSLLSLQELKLSQCDIVSLPESIKYLPRLKQLKVDDCAMLQSIPALPNSIEILFVVDCKSLQTVLTSTREPSKNRICFLLFPNCIKLDEHSYDAILKDAIVRIEPGAKPLSAIVSEDDNGIYTFETIRSGKVHYILPARRDKLRNWFHHHFPQDLVTVELPPNVLGFVFYLVLSQVQPYHIGYCGSFGCECYLETGWGEMINITNFVVDDKININHCNRIQMMSDHVFLWYDAQCSKQATEAIKKSWKAINDGRSTYKSNLTFKFFARTRNNEELVINECGLRWIYPLKDQIAEKKRGCKSKRSGEIHESEAGAVQNRIAEFETDKQEEMVPPTKKYKPCVFGTRSNPEGDEIEDLRHLLEELLHI